MSQHGFHVHGPHDHELEHAAQHDPEGMAGQLAVITAILATIGALFSYQGGATQANAALQIAIAMAAIALLTKRRWLEWGTLAVGGVGVVVGVFAWFHL